DALRAARAGQNGTLTDKTWRDRLAERFGSRWRIIKFRAHPNGDDSMSPTPAGTNSVKQPNVPPRPRPHVVKPHNGRRRAGPATGERPGNVPAVKSNVTGGIPDYQFVSDGTIEPGMLAAWQPHSPDHPSGVVLINVDHPVIRQQVQFW